MCIGANSGLYQVSALITAFAGSEAEARETVGRKLEEITDGGIITSTALGEALPMDGEGVDDMGVFDASTDDDDDADSDEFPEAEGNSGGAGEVNGEQSFSEDGSLDGVDSGEDAVIEAIEEALDAESDDEAVDGDTDNASGAYADELEGAIADDDDSDESRGDAGFPVTP